MKKAEGGPQVQFTSWYEDGITVSLHLRADVMEKLLKDPFLRKYETES